MRKVSTQVRLSSPRRLTWTETFRYLLIFCKSKIQPTSRALSSHIKVLPVSSVKMGVLAQLPNSLNLKLCVARVSDLSERFEIASAPKESGAFH